jgi:hypothetical protein
MVTVSWDTEGMILVDMPRDETINSSVNSYSLKPCRRVSREFDFTKVAEVLLEHKTGQPHTSLKTQEAVT